MPKKDKEFEFPMRKFTNNMTLVVQITSEFKVRKWIALRLVQLAAMVLGCDFKNDEEESTDA